MLVLDIPETELFDESKEEFIRIKKTDLRLEHSLVSISKWESKWKKPFLTRDKKNVEETLDYIRCMTINQNIDPNVYYAISIDGYKKINEYMDDAMTATTFSDNGTQSRSHEIITAEVIYYLMFSYGIPMECQKWHLNKLLTLIRIFNVKNSPNKKMSKHEILSSNRSLNAARRAAMHTRG